MTKQFFVRGGSFAPDGIETKLLLPIDNGLEVLAQRIIALGQILWGGESKIVAVPIRMAFYLRESKSAVKAVQAARLGFASDSVCYDHLMQVLAYRAFLVFRK